MTSAQIRQSFLDFFKSKQHTIVPSSSLMPDSPNLLFTNAGMNQFVPIFLGQTKCPYNPGRAADTQKCIRAGGKHNDLDDVGLDTYHHTFFEMLGNWSFGDYFKREAIDWAWELVVTIWKFPPQRLYATIYSPDKSKNDPSEFDQEAWNFWAEKFRSVGLDPAVHIVNGNKKDNFWMMGETGPCGPCSELHVDLTPNGDTRGSLVNKGDARCIEIWNLVFIQFNANPDGTFSPLPAKHVDTGMGFERVTSIIQGTKNFSDFANAKISNYETDIFRPIFNELEKLSGKKYGSTLPGDAIAKVEADEPLKTSGEARGNIIEVEAGERGAHHGSIGDDDEDFPVATVSAEQVALDIAFRVIADHIRTLSFAIADGIQPGNTDRNYVLRRILRRAVRYGRTLGFHEPFFYKLVDVLADTMGDVFSEIRTKKKIIQETIQREEEAFNKTLDKGIAIFETSIHPIERTVTKLDEVGFRTINSVELNRDKLITDKISGSLAFQLYDTYGFPLDLTELMARERGLTVDKEGFEKLMEEQRARARAAQKKEVISLSQIETTAPTKFVGFETLESPARVLEVVSVKDKTAVVLDTSPFYAEMGGQVGDTGELILNPVAADVSRLKSIGADSRPLLQITSTQKSGNTFLHFVEGENLPAPGDEVFLRVKADRRNAIQRHHTVTHLLHWALHEVASKEASQKGSFVGPDKLTFDFNSAPLTPAQVADIEKLVNERILENAGVSWTEVAHADVKNRKDVMQFFGDKYGDTVRVVQIGGHAGKLDGYSMELCGGTHTRATGEIGLFRIISEAAVAAGVRRIEAVAGLNAYGLANEQLQLIRSIAGKINSPVHELDKKIESLLAHQKELEKSLKSAQQREAAGSAKDLLAKVETVNGIPAIIANLGAADGDTLQTIVDALKSQFKGVVVLGGASNGAVSLVAAVTSDFTAKIQAGKIIQTIAPLVGGKGGGKPDNARGGGKDAAKLDEALTKAKTLLG
ncbi:MAG TPA: alanine--tRNA ligase [Verrucomicrobiae bacterium]|nr:alanine--tRNA ligase [Verrucomicrobiae bacterium]